MQSNYTHEFMTIFTATTLLGKQKRTLLLAGLLFGAVSFFAYTVTVPRFEAQTDFQIVQTGNTGQDFYTLFKTAEYFGKIFSEAIESERFLTAVQDAGGFNRDTLSTDSVQALSLWRDMVTVEKNVELGIMRVSIVSDSQREAERASKALATVLVEKNSLFHGGDAKSIEVRILSGPLVERNPSFVEILSTVGIAFVGGVIVTSLLILWRHGVLFGRDTHSAFTIPRDMFRRPMA